MTLPKSWNDPAFPVMDGNRAVPFRPGLTKGEYFTAMAMQGLLASCTTIVKNGVKVDTIGAQIELARGFAICTLEMLESTDGGEVGSEKN